MRDYGKLSPFFWTRGSGKRLRGDPEAQVVAAYLATSPTANMIGIYYLALATISNDTGVALEQVRDALGRIAKAGYAFYDFEAELVWIPNHARFEVGATMSQGDKRRKKLLVELAHVGEHRFACDFLSAYGEAFGLPVASKPMVKPPSVPAPEGASETPEGASADREPIRSDPIRSDPGRLRAREGLVRIDLPVVADVESVWAARTMSRDAGQPIAECWANFCGYYATQDFGSREAMMGKWSKWIGRQCELADKDRQADYDRKDRLAAQASGPRPVDTPKAPYHQSYRPPRREERAPPGVAAAALAKLTEQIGKLE